MGDLDITSDITINGTGTTINANGIDRVLHVHGDGKLTLNDSIITGGRVLTSDSYGGGILMESNVATIINRSSILGNVTVSRGGGIAARSGSLEIADSIIDSNRAVQGGGVYLELATAVIVNSTLSGNRAPGGGGISVTGSRLDVVNSTLSGNVAFAGPGGAIRLLSGNNITLSNSTVVGNYADLGGGGLYSEGDYFSLFNSIVTGNTVKGISPDVNGTVISNGHNVIGNATGSRGFIGSDNVGTPASQVVNLTLADNGGRTKTHALVASLTNPAINRGSAILGVTTDQRGVLRPFGSGVDIGAVESQFPNPTLSPQSQTRTEGESVTFTALAEGLFAGSAPSSLTDDAQLLPGELLLSPNHGYKLAYQNDGNLVLYNGAGAVLSVSNTFGQTPGRAIMQVDGNFVVYGPSNEVQFHTNTIGNPGAVLRLQDDGNLVIYSASGAVLYNFNTIVIGSPAIPTVQWQVSTDNGASFNDIPGATNLTLSFATTLTDNNQQYRARFSNVFASNLPTTAATLSMLEAPSLIVTTNGDVINPSDGLTSLREAILYANNKSGTDAITFTPEIAGGTVTLSIAGANENAGLTGDLDIISDITINGADTTINANGIDRVLHVHGGGKLTLNDATITGGVVLNDSAAGAGGGILMESNVATIINRSIIAGNFTSSRGGGIAALSGSLEIADSTIDSNRASGGGGVYMQFATAVIVNSTFSGNRAGDGGGMGVTGSRLDIVNSTFSGNVSFSGPGGAIRQISNNIITLTNSTFVGNFAVDGGGGLYSDGDYFSLFNSIVTGNTANFGGPDVNGRVTSNGHNVFGNATNSFGFVGSDNVGTPASQVVNLTLADNGGRTKTHALVASLTNPAINRGSAILGVTTDQRGVLRPFGSGVDIGAVESQFPIPTLSPQSQTKTEGESVTFTALAEGLFAGSVPNSLTDDAQLLPGEFLLSPNHGYKLAYQNDGNLVLYSGAGAALSVSNTFGQTPGRSVMQFDGNFVVYGPGNEVQFHTNTFGNPGAVMRLKDDGNLVIYSDSGAVLYNFNTIVFGSPAIPTVQWQVSTDNGMSFNDIPGATSQTFSFATTLADNNKQYRARFSNAVASNVPTTTAVLTVISSDVTPPTIVRLTRQNPTAAITNEDTLQFRVEFSEQVQNIVATDFIISGGSSATVLSVLPIQGTGETVYLLTVSGGNLAGFNGTVGIDLASSQNISDIVGNRLPTTEPAIDETYLLDNVAPLVSSVVIDDGTRQRSRVRSITVNFDSSIVFNQGAFDLRTLDGTLISVSTDVPAGTQTNRVVLTFPGTIGGSLADGNYRLTIVGALVHDAAGNNGVSRIDDFFRFYGDVDGDRDVDALDSKAFNLTYRKTSGDAGFSALFDYDGDGDVDAADSMQFNLRYRRRI